MYWLEVSVITDGEAAEAVAKVLRPFAYGDGVVLEQRGDEDNPDPAALEPEVAVKIYIPESDDSPELRRRIEEIIYFLGRLYPMPAPTFRQLKDEDWANAWKTHYHPFRVGRRLWIWPTWIEQPQQAAGDLVLRLDPGMAFGTGLHPTTQMCLRALEDYVRPGMRVLDVGTGSGILAIAAAKLGAAEVWGVDTDPLAVQTAEANAIQNGVQVDVTLFQGGLASVTAGDWDVVVVNILAPVIEMMLLEADLLNYVAENGRLILSGIIDTQVEGVAAAVNAAGGLVDQTLAVRDWQTLVIKKSAMA